MPTASAPCTFSELLTMTLESTGSWPTTCTARQSVPLRFASKVRAHLSEIIHAQLQVGTTNKGEWKHYGSEITLDQSVKSTMIIIHRKDIDKRYRTKQLCIKVNIYTNIHSLLPWSSNNGPRAKSGSGMAHTRSLQRKQMWNRWNRDK